MKNRRLIFIFAGIALLGICACGAFFMLFMADDSDTEATERGVEATSAVVESATATDLELEENTDNTSVPTSELVVEPTSPPLEEPTNVPEPTDPPQPTAVPTVGTSRSNPLTTADLIEAPNWDVEVLEVVRGEEAWSMLQAANQFNEPPADGMQYILVRLKVTSTYQDTESHSIGSSDFGLTGDRLILYDSASVVVPEPELNAELFTGGEAEGWIAFAAGQDETQLTLVVDELLNFDDDRYRYVALDDNASIAIEPALFDVIPSNDGISRENPVPPDSQAVTDEWEVMITEVVRGDAAWAAVQSANQFNEPPAEGMEYVAVKILVRNIGIIDRASTIDGSAFKLTGENNILYDWPSIVDPEPTLDVDLYPGGQYEGWTVMAARVGEEQLMVRFEPFFEFSDDNIRYLALTEAASLTVPLDLAEIEPNGRGEDRASPAPLGETVITDDWEITALEVIRGDEALVRVQEANQFNEPPEPGTEYIAVRVKVRNISQTDEPERISDSSFSLVDESNVEYDLPSIVEPEPALDISLYPGGEYEGWVVLQSSEGSSNPVAVISSFFGFNETYFSLVP